MAELDELHSQIKNWQEGAGLTRFPEPGEAFDAAEHDVDGVVETRCSPKEFASHPMAQGRYLGHWRSGDSLPPPR